MEEKKYCPKWTTSSLKMDNGRYYIVGDGVLSQKDFTLLFEGENGKKDIPVEVTNKLNIYSNAKFSSTFFEFVSKKGIAVSIFDRNGNFIGEFIPKK